LIGVYYIVRKGVVVDSMALVLLFFVIQQLFIMCRVFLRIWRLSSVYRFYLSSNNPIFGSGL
jgi:hypothetical protein